MTGCMNKKKTDINNERNTPKQIKKYINNTYKQKEIHPNEITNERNKSITDT